MDARKVAGTERMIDYTPGVAKTGGTVIVIGDRPLVLQRDYAANEMGAIAAGGGVYECTADGAQAAGDRVFWDGTAKKLTKTGGQNKHFGYLIPDSSAAADGDLVLAQHLPEGNGSARQTLPVETVAAAGNSQATAGLLTQNGFCFVTGADATKGVKLLAAKAGDWLIIKNDDAANAVLKIYPATGDAINAIAANGAFSIAAKTSVLLTALDATTWYTLPLLAS